MTSHQIKKLARLEQGKTRSSQFVKVHLFRLGQYMQYCGLDSIPRESKYFDYWQWIWISLNKMNAEKRLVLKWLETEEEDFSSIMNAMS